jgi:hypothetical protein
MADGAIALLAFQKLKKPSVIKSSKSKEILIQSEQGEHQVYLCSGFELLLFEDIKRVKLYLRFLHACDRLQIDILCLSDDFLRSSTTSQPI